jgi:DNA sulfur modification protein DndE
MSHSLPSSVRVTQQAKDQLVKLKRITGIKQWNVLCRWALCASLADDSPPLVRTVRPDSNVEMTWKVFAGPLDAELEALLLDRLANGGEDFESLTDLLAAHLHRGIGQLAGELRLGGDIRDLIGLVEVQGAR